MKKIVFALQVFGLIALLPVYVVLEMNHGTRSAPALETNVLGAEKTESPSLDFSSSITAYPIAYLTSEQAAFKTKKKVGGTCCSCKPCKCGTNCTCSDL